MAAGPEVWLLSQTVATTHEQVKALGAWRGE